tara:strand:- start:924 stop:1595 length:672 start_codon:yes stop_codon:yes gene_type:complete
MDIDKFWLDNPLIIFKKERITELWPDKQFSASRKLNAITRVIILLTILGYFISKSVKIIITGIVTLLFIVFIYHIQVKKEQEEQEMKNIMKEGFDSMSPKFDKIMEQNFTTPTKNNPMMNVLLPEIHDKPNRKEAAPSYNTNIRKEINEKAKSNLNDDKLYNNLGDNLSHQHMMRNFHSMPNTSVPNNQKDFAMFCYGSMKSCKEGDETACSKNGRRIQNIPY